MQDVKLWIEDIGIKAAYECFNKPPLLPYALITEEAETISEGNRPLIVNRKISIELYTEKVDKKTEKLIEDLLSKKSISSKKNREWIETEKFFQTVYDFDLVEKLQGGN